MLGCSSVVERRYLLLADHIHKGGSMESTLRLFKALPIEDNELIPIVDEDLLKQTLPKGFMFDGKVSVNYLRLYSPY